MNDISAPEHAVSVDRLTNFNGQLNLGGIGFFGRRRVLGIDLHLGDGRYYEIEDVNLPSPEVTRIYGHRAAACRFSMLLPTGQLDPGALAGELKFRLDDGTTHRHRIDLGDPSDRTADMQAAFYAMLLERPAGHLLEVGSRERTGTNQRHLIPPGWHYVGFDIMDGPNVDIVGDAHKASSFLPHGHFDAVMSFVVFEHLLMPWKVALELNRVMALGGIGLILAPQTWPLHEEPADYFRFSRHSWKALFNRATGFEIIKATDNGKAFIIPQKQTPSTAFSEIWTGALMSGVLFRKTSETALQWSVEMEDISTDEYPL